MKKFYIACQFKENGKYYACVVPVTDSDNLLSKLKINNIISANICPTKTAAGDLVLSWRKQYIENGEYMFSDILF
jgi:hypothetical protein